MRCIWAAAPQEQERVRGLYALRFFKTLRSLPNNRLSAIGRRLRLPRTVAARLRTRRQRLTAAAVAAVFTAGLVLPIILNQPQAQAWWDNSWNARRTITFNNAASTENLTDFVVRVSLTSSNIDYNKTQNLGQDLRFVDSNDVTVLNYEIERWDKTGTSEIWVRVPQIDANSNADFIYMYYDNATASDAQNATGVWASVHKAVWHSQQTSGTAYPDSTANANTGTKQTATRPSPATGKIDGGQNYNSSTSDYININTAADDIATGSVTYSIWFRLTSAFSSASPTTQALMNLGDANSVNDVSLTLNSSDGKLRFDAYNGSNSFDARSSQTSWAANTWYFASATLNTSNGAISLYVNGSPSGPGGTSTSPYRGSTASAEMNLGRNLGNNWFFNGTLDEPRIASTARSAKWIEAEYASQNNTMNTFGTEELGASSNVNGWLDGCYKNRRPITFNNATGAENLENFPVRVSLTTSNIDYAKTKAGGADIRFTTSNGTSQLAYEIEDWVSGGTSEIWVNVPMINAASTTNFIYLYYNCSSATDGQNAAGVWNSGYRNVYHMKGSSGSAVLPDSATGNTTENAAKKSGTANGQPANVTTGFIGPAQNFTRTSTDDATISGLQGSPANITISGWGNLTTGDSFSSDFINVGDRVYLRIDQSGTSTRGGWIDTAGSREISVASTYAGTGWHHFALTVNTTNSIQQLVIDGAVVGTANFTNALSWSGGGSNTLLGRHAVNVGDPRYWDGRMDEIRISSVARSSEWLKAEYASATNAMNSFGAEQNFAPDAPVLIAPANAATQISRYPQFRLRASDPRDPSYLRYEIQVCSDSSCNTVLRTMDQSATQTGWSGQDTQAGTAYKASTTVAGSTIAVHTYQPAPLNVNQMYYWRARSIDPDSVGNYSDYSPIYSFTTETPPPPPVLESPVNGGILSPGMPFRLRSTDPNSDYLQYRVDICSAVCNGSNTIQTYNQNSSQSGWASQGAAGGTAYEGAPDISNSQIAVLFYAGPALTAGTTYYWRGYSIDPGGTNTFSTASSSQSFVYGTPPKVEIRGGTNIRGGTSIGQ